MTLKSEKKYLFLYIESHYQLDLVL